MADRPNHLPGYQMPSANFMNLTPQQQASMASQQPQPAMNSSQQIPGVTNPEHQRLWQQMQDRHRAMGGADGMGQHQLSTHQMADLLRNQPGLAQQLQGHQQIQQQQPPQLQQAQQFSNLSGMSQLNGTFPTQNALAAMQRQQGLQGGMPNPQLAQLLAQRNGMTNPAMIQMNRQLGLLGRAQKQQPQNGPANFGQPGQSLAAQQNFGQLPFQPGMFPPKSDDGRAPTPQGQHQFPLPAALSNGLNQGHGDVAQQAQQALRGNDGRALTIDEIRFKVQQMRRSIEAEKRNLESVPKPTAPDAIVALRERHRDIQGKEYMLSRMLEHARQLVDQQARLQSQQHGVLNGTEGASGAAMNLGFPNTPQQQMGQQQLQPSQNWMPQVGNANVPVPNQLAGNGLPGNQQMPQTGPTQVSHQQMNSPFHSNLAQSQQQQQQQAPVPRSGPTPQQHQHQSQQMIQAFLQQSSNNSSPPSTTSTAVPVQGNFGQQAPTLENQDAQHRPDALSFPPLARDRFMAMLTEWWKRSGVKFDSRILMIGNRQIDIHQLHTEVLQFGGAVNVKRHELWNVIAAKMGWGQAGVNETGRTPNQIAEQLKAIYEQLLESFEQTYMAAAMKQSLTAPPQQASEHQGGPIQPGAGSNQPGAPMLSTNQAMHMIRLANMSAEQLRLSGYPENLIQNVERSRPVLEATWRKMQAQRLQQQQQQQLQQQGSILNSQLAFQNQNQNPSLPPQGTVSNGNALGHPGLSAGSSQSTEQTQQRPQPNMQQLMQQNMQTLGQFSNLRRPAPEIIKQAADLIERMKQEISKDRSFLPEHVKHLSDADKVAFPGLFENLCNITKGVFGVLHIYFAATSDSSIVKGIVNMIDICEKQRQLLQAAPPVYVLDIATVQKLTKTALDARTKVFVVVHQLRTIGQLEQNQTRAPIPRLGDGGLVHLPPAQQGHSPASIAPSPASIPRPPTVQPQPAPVPQQNLRPPPASAQTVSARSIAHGKGKALAATSPNVTDPAPSPSTSTPLPSNATPTHLQASPQTPKSPKTKGPAKTRKARRPSKAVQPNAAAIPSTPTSSSTTAGGGAANVSTPAAEPSPSPAQATPSPAESSLKRVREEEDVVSAGSEGATREGTPSKRIKTDWESAPDVEPSKRQTEAEGIKTTGQAARFYNDMTQILELSNDTTLPPDLHDTLAQLVKTVGNGLPIPGSSSLSNLPNAGTSSPNPADGDDSFLSFLDFTAFQQEDEKAETPELVPSSTNPSPESGLGSDADHPLAPASSGFGGDRARIAVMSELEPKSDYSDTGADPLRLGMWGEIDGGESGFFNFLDMSKWDSVPPPSGDSSWVIST